MKKSVFILAAALLLSACAETPEDVKQNADQRAKGTEAQAVYIPEAGSDPSAVFNLSSGQEGTHSLAEVRDQLAEDLAADYGNLTIRFASVGEGEEMPVYRLKPGLGEGFDLSALAAEIYPGEDIEGSGISEYLPRDDGGTAAPEGFEGYKAGYTEEGIDHLVPFANYFDQWMLSPLSEEEYGTSPRMVTAESSGEVFVSQTGYLGDDEEQNYYNYENSSCSAAHYYPQYEDVSEVSYAVYGGEEWALDEAVAFAEEFYNKSLAPSDPEEFYYRVRRVDVIPTSDSTFGYLMDLQRFTKGGLPFDSDSFGTIDGISAENGHRALLGSCSTAFLTKKDTLTRVEKSFSYSLEEGEPGGGLLTLGEAAELLRSAFAQYMLLEFDTAELCYAVTVDSYPETDVGGKTNFNEGYALQYCQISARPYWCFKEPENHDLDTWSTGTAYYVDACTGAIKLVSNRMYAG
ncbi:MAG: hypothetical protein IJ746_06660 [Ruminococcus sp.]|nr:hypothetical protein [Ruminococcus sp.]